LVEEEVLNVAFGEQYAGFKRVSKRAAICVTSRLALRVALAHTELNPSWNVYRWAPGVFKFPASTHNEGIVFAPQIETVRLLDAYCPELACFGIWEEKLEGAHYEVDGVVLGGSVKVISFVSQVWDGQQITDYIPQHKHALPPYFQAALHASIEAIGLKDSPFCIEFMRTLDGWKVIDFHARLGEDEQLKEIMCDGKNPIGVICRLAGG